MGRFFVRNMHRYKYVIYEKKQTFTAYTVEPH